METPVMICLSGLVPWHRPSYFPSHSPTLASKPVESASSFLLFLFFRAKPATGQWLLSPRRCDEEESSDRSNRRRESERPPLSTLHPFSQSSHRTLRRLWSHLRRRLQKNPNPAPLLPRSSPTPPPQTVATILDLKNFAASHCESFKRRLDLSHPEILKEFDASKTRIAKRLKTSQIQTQACLQLTEEAEKKYKKMSDRICENTQSIKFAR